MAILVAGGSSIKDAAAEVGASERQGYRLSSSSEFRRRVSELRLTINDQAVGKLSNRAVRAVDTLSDLLDHDEAAVRLNAAKTILTMMPRISEHVELRHRLDLLENRSTP